MEYTELILDMLNRIIQLEKEIELLKSEKENTRVTVASNPNCETVTNEISKTQRDKTRYMFNGNMCLKNKLVLAVVRDYVSKNKSITCQELKKTFDKSLQGSIGVVEYEFLAKERNDYNVRFFADDDEVIHLVDGNMLVCSQWGILNISNFIRRAEQLGYKIEQIIRE